ncbi:MAG: thioredoxin fold domain-containing protein [archaeon]|nr:thioredoxin fold domain-containing protein [archaeon]MCP8313522.1 thioredoxin fold domain-containing protein [archaeon]MCP8317456.1 thioredoxin fold domain-containing protein [archaeon]
MSEELETEHKHLILTLENFDKIINSEKPVIVDFWASSCFSCRFMLPVFEKLANKYGKKMIFGRLNVLESVKNRDIAARYQVFSIPSYVVFVEGKPVDRVTSSAREEDLEELIKKHINA